jgi:glycosyltransferase involved in cell wall biosynthesis
MQTDGRQGRRVRLLAFVTKERGYSPGQRFRLEQWAPRLARDHAIDIDFVAFESRELTRILDTPGHVPQKAYWVLRDFVRRSVPVLRSRRYDGAIVYREIALLGPAIYERLLAALGVPIFFDFDDAIWFDPGPRVGANGVFARLHFYGKTATICRLSSAVFAGNGHLADYARQWNRDVHVVPTSIELDAYSVRPELPTTEPFTISWSGSFSTLAHFEHARRALEAFARTRSTRVVVICNRPPAVAIAGAENVFVPWAAAGEVEALGDCHVGIMPLPDDDFARGKCGLKALQYMAVGRPVVISPVGMNASLIQTGVNGVLASSVDEWVSAFEALAASPERRRVMGAEARRTIETAYSAERLAAQVSAIVRSTLDPQSDARVPI